MSWRHERGSRWGDGGGGRERHRDSRDSRDQRDGRDSRDAVWEPRRSASPVPDRGSPRDRRDRDRDRERERDRFRHRELRDERRDRYERPDRRDSERRDQTRDSRDRSERERRREPRQDDEDVPPPPSPPKISEGYSRTRSRSRDRDQDHEDRNFNVQQRPDWSKEQVKDENAVQINCSPGDWFCKCGLYNFKRRQVCYRRNCNGNRSEGIVYGGDDKNSLTESAGITKRLLFRRLDALTTEEKILEEIKERCSKGILDSIAGITIGRETLTGASKCLAYINFNSISDSMAAHSELVNLMPPLEIDGREVLVSFYNEPKKNHKTQNQDYAAYAAYQMAQSQYISQQQALSEADRVNAAAAVAASAISQAQARSTWTPANAPTFNTTNNQASTMTNVPTGDGKTTYTAPDVRTFMYDETSGYYYDPVTGLYYDGNTQYFFNSQTNQYMYWDGTTNTYIAASQAQQKPEEATQAVTTAEVAAPPEEKKKKDKEDKVKVAKKIAKDMERWARTLNQKKENAKSNIVAEQILDTAASKGSVDIGFSVLSAGPSQPIMVRELSPPPIGEEFLLKKVPEPITALENDDGIIDWVKLTCLLCKRKFPSADVLTKHKTLSDLHKQNLAEFRRKNELLPQTNSYRDRAAERRMKFGEDEPIPVSSRKRYEPPEPAPMSHPPPSVVDTIGGKMLQKMGWSEGRGLGKSEQGRIAPIEAEQRPGLAGLGQKRGIYTPTPGETYRDTVKKLMIARYKEVVGNEEN